VLRKVFVPNMDKVTGELEGLHNEEFYDLYSPNYIQMIKSSRMRWSGRVVGMWHVWGTGKVHTGFQ
jgi:hypothetical protein